MASRRQSNTIAHAPQTCHVEQPVLPLRLLDLFKLACDFRAVCHLQ